MPAYTNTLSKSSYKSSPKKPKNVSSRKKIVNRAAKKHLGRILITASIILVSALFLGTYGLFKYLNKNFASALSVSNYSIDNDDFPSVAYITVEDFNADPIVVKKVEFFIFDKTKKEVVRYDIPLDFVAAVPGKFGQEEISRIFALGALNSKDPLVDGTNLMEKTLFKTFAYKVDKYILIDQSLEKDTDKLFNGSSVLSYLDLKEVSGISRSLHTDMTLKELYEINRFISSIPLDKKVIHNSADAFAAADEEIKELTYDSKIVSEKKNIALLNGTDFSGVATFASRVVTNMGGRVVASSNTQNTYDTSCIITDDPTSSTVAFLSRVFHITKILTKADATGFFESEIDRADITVIFGFDISGQVY